MSRLLTASLLPLCGLLSALPAQRQPNWLPHTPSWEGRDDRLDFTKSPALIGVSGHPRPIWCVGAYKMPSDPPGTFTLSFTVRALQGYGNPGFSGMVLGKWTPGAATPLVLTNEAAQVNEAFVDYNLVLEPTTRDAGGRKVGGRYGTFDRFTFVNGALTYVGPYLAARADDTANFGSAMPINGLQGLVNPADPVTGHVGGKLKIFYNAQLPGPGGQPVDGIFMDDLLTPTTNPSAAGNPVLVAGPEGTGWIAHAPIPINGDDGETKGLLLCQAGPAFAWSDIYFAADLDPATPSVKVSGDQVAFLSGGGAAGGELYYHTRDNENLPVTLHSAFAVGDTVRPGRRAQVNISAYSKPGTCARVTLFASPFWLRRTFSLPGMLGEFGIAPVFKLGSRRTGADQRVHFDVRVPKLAVLRGLDLNVQGLVSFTDRDGNRRRAVTNTAQVRVR